MPDWPATGAHPELETLAAYVDGTLGDRERGEVETHLAACEDCYELMAELVQSEADEADATELTPAPAAPSVAPAETPKPSGTVLPFYRRRWFVGAAAGLAAAATLLLVLRLQSRRFDDWDTDQRYERLVAAVGERRFIEPRVTGGFGYGPLHSSTRGGGALGDLSVLAAAGELQRAAEEHPEVSAIHGWAVAQLLLGRHDPAVQLLEQAVLEQPGDARLHTDLSAAYLERSTQPGRESDVPRALNAALRAIEIDPALVEALFNRALALERLGLDREAEVAWSEYVARDPGSQWGEEANTRLRVLRDKLQRSSIATPSRIDQLFHDRDQNALLQITRDRPWLMRDEFETVFLSAWSTAVLRNDVSSESGIFGLGSAITAEYTRVSEDTFLRDLLDLISKARDSTRVVNLAAVAARYVQAISEARIDNATRADEHFAAVVAEDDWTNSPIATVARFELSALPARDGRHSTAIEQINRSIPELLKKKYWTTAGRALWRLGLARWQRGELEAATSAYTSALDAFRRARHIVYQSSMHGLLGEAHRGLRDYASAWHHHLKALALIQQAPNDRIRHQALVQSLMSAEAQGLHHAQSALSNALLANADQWGYTAARIIARYQQARAMHALGRLPEALSRVAECKQYLSHISDPPFRARMEAEVFQVEGELTRFSDTPRAETALRHSLERFVQLGATDRMPTLHLYLGEALLHSNNTTAAVTAFELGLNLLEDERRRLSLTAFRLTHASALEPLRRHLFQTALESGAGDLQTLLLADRIKAPETTGSVRTSNPEAREHSAAVLSFAVMDEVTVSWLEMDGMVASIRHPLGRPKLERLVKRYRWAVQTATETRDVSGELFNALVEPWRSRIPDGVLLTIIPDEPLNALPFSDFWDARRQQFLIAANAIAVAPSRSWLFGRRRPQATGTPRVLVVAAPGDVVDGSGASPLPGARAEAYAIASQYSDAELLVGEHATKSRVLEALRAADIVHIASHAIANPIFPEQSRLVLSANASESTPDLYAHELEIAVKRMPRVVVLAACRTGHVEDVPGERALAIARVFLANGSESVIATMWDIDDRATSTILTGFHAHLRAGITPPEALRFAQLEYLSNNPQSAHPRWWAGLTAFGQ